MDGVLAPTADPRTSGGPLAGLLAVELDLDTDRLAVPSAARPLALSLLAAARSPLVVVVPRTSDAEALADDLIAFLGPERVALFPPWETLPHERLGPQPATVGRRWQVLWRLRDPATAPAVVVTSVRAVLQPMDPAFVDVPALVVDRRYRGFDALLERLVALGYRRVPQVEQRGEFAVRGGIVDVFSSVAEHAVRIEFFGDDVEDLRAFSVADQRSTGPVEQVTIGPARELVWDETLRERARRAAARAPALRDALTALADGADLDGAEALALLLHPRPGLLPELIGATVAVVDPPLVTERAERLRAEVEALLEVGWDAAALGSDHQGFAALDELRRSPVVEVTPFGADGWAEPAPQFRGQTDALAATAGALLAEGLRVVVTVGGHGTAVRVAELLEDGGVPTVLHDRLDPRPAGRRVEVVPSSLRHGFVARTLGVAVFGEFDLFGPRQRGRAGRRLASRSTAAETVATLEPGDPVVHRTHGVGRYAGIVTREVRTPTGQTARRDYVVVEYARGDRLYVPSDQVDALSRYTGGEQPPLMRLGGAEWTRAKARARRAARDIAADLVRLYTIRMRSPGRACSPDGPWQRELEDAFPHEDTPDQAAVTEEIKRDLEAPVPMDRLLTGDVGFGKTEVAVRAAGKVVFDGRQVAVLVPTTLLAQQHHETFRERFAGFPVDIRMLSRFTPPAERRAILDGLAAGTVDIVIGTHALLSPNVRFRDLGLLIIDEEQRFGVRHKERLKQLRTDVDVLTMTATPIPRTLEMALAGIRGLSVIETPPEDRQPVVTFVGPYDEAQVALAIRRELLREGQVFYVHNQVSTIDRAAARLRELVPDARIRVAHGQMPEAQLERVMVDFWHHEFDVLVCTTIIESGLDIPTANTLIVERADLLGLAELHQLRGRVGRSAVRGYAYLFHPPHHALSEGAYERLRTVAEHTRLGAGLEIALRDLELRGAGNLLGAQQSGHIATVGLDTFIELVSEEIGELVGRPTPPKRDVTIELPVDAHLPADYVPDEGQRLALYRRIAAADGADALAALRDELTDRFGPLPAPVQRLLGLAALKAALARWGVEEVSLVARPRTLLRVRPVVLPDSRQVRLARRWPGARYRPDEAVVEIPVPDRTTDLVAWTARTLGALLG